LLGAGKASGEVLAAKEQKIQELLEPTIEAMGFALWGLEYLSQGRHTLLRLYIDGENGIGVDDCASVSRQVSSVLDVEDPISGEYTLEVSSPGLDRLLFSLEQYPGYVGEWIEIRLRVPFEGRRKFKGTLKGIEGEDVVVQVEDQEFLLPHSSIDRAQVKPRT
jgi:ribosome maturation factor RimP